MREFLVAVKKTKLKETFKCARDYAYCPIKLSY